MATERVAVVTGASSGIGREAAKALASQGWRVIAIGRDPQRSGAAAQELRVAGPKTEMIVADLPLLAEVATSGSCLRGRTCHGDCASAWVLQTRVGIVAASIAEQADVDLYVDAEISTRPEMARDAPVQRNDASGRLFRARHAGPGLFDYGAASGSTHRSPSIQG